MSRVFKDNTELILSFNLFKKPHGRLQIPPEVHLFSLNLTNQLDQYFIELLSNLKNKNFFSFTTSSSWRGNNIELYKGRTIGIMIILKRTFFQKKKKQTPYPIFMDSVQRRQRKPLRGDNTFNH